MTQPLPPQPTAPPRRLCTCCDHTPVSAADPVCGNCRKAGCAEQGFCVVAALAPLETRPIPPEPMLRQPEDTL